ncbi:MAG: Flp family type IVb pilin [Deltaproteobacteria bacterium]|nr:Flp family type IVb pilin [Deltaproteobacteria bacterium]MBI3293953.1 Flp family type IVb pilin [Deltaproteobacteria bacterium]
MNQRGQGLVEYLILVCLVGVATIGVVSVVGQNLRARYATISSALRGEKVEKELVSPEVESYQIRGFHDYGASAVAPGGR